MTYAARARRQHAPMATQARSRRAPARGNPIPAASPPLGLPQALGGSCHPPSLKGARFPRPRRRTPAPSGLQAARWEVPSAEPASWPGRGLGGRLSPGSSRPAPPEGAFASPRPRPHTPRPARREGRPGLFRPRRSTPRLAWPEAQAHPRRTLACRTSLALASLPRAPRRPRPASLAWPNLEATSAHLAPSPGRTLVAGASASTPVASASPHLAPGCARVIRPGPEAAAHSEVHLIPFLPNDVSVFTVAPRLASAQLARQAADPASERLALTQTPLRQAQFPHCSATSGAGNGSSLQTLTRSDSVPTSVYKSPHGECGGGSGGVGSGNAGSGTKH